MRARRPKVIAALAAALCSGAAGLILRTGALVPEVPVFRVHRETFTRLVAAEGNLRALQSTSLAPRMESPLKLAWVIEDGSRVKKGDVVARFDPTEMEKKLVDGEADRATAESKIVKRRVEAQATVRGSERDAELAEFELDVVRRFPQKDPEVFSRVAIIESEIDEGLARERLDHAHGSRRANETLAKTDVDLFSIERRKAEIKIRQAREGLAALELRAPHEGIIIFKRDYYGNLPKEGDIVWSRQPLAELPSIDAMEAEVYVLEADAGGLAVGAPATVIVEAQPEVTYRAKVKHVDNLPKPRVRGVPVQYFGLTLELEKTDPGVMKPGQRVRAAITVEEEAAVLSVPRQAVFEKENRKFVFRRRGREFEPLPVTLGSFSLGRVVVAEGLREGDEIALRDPAQTLEEALKGKEEERPKGSERAPAGPTR